jgi:hypothetical protein
MAQLDHLVVAAADLDQGSDYLEEVLWMRPGPGGKHPLMGTHNRLLKLGEESYIELIAVDHLAPKPTRSRWFNLDSPELQAQLKQRPRLIHWVARVSGIDEVARRGTMMVGEILEASRGDLSWKIGVHRDGMPAYNGLFPTLIDWGDSPHPTTQMPEMGLSLLSLAGWHPQPKLLSDWLELFEAGHLIQIQPGEARLEAAIGTAGGMRVLD